MCRSDRGFTFVEILITLSLMAILFVPMMQLFSHAMEGTSFSRDLITAVSLARWEMERVKNVGVSLERLKAQGDQVLWPAEGEPPAELNGRTWRIVRTLKPGSEPMEVTVEVRREDPQAAEAEGASGASEPLVTLATLLTENSWGRPQGTGP